MMEDNVSSDEDEVQDEVQLPAGEEETDDEEQQFDISIAASHSYMGPGLAAVSGPRRVIEAGWEGRVPVIGHHGTVFPGETVPMLLTFAHDMTFLSNTIQNDKLFGLLSPDENNMVSGYGVLCEVYECGEVDVGEDARVSGWLRGAPGAPPCSVKARATHRFRFKKLPKHPLSIQAYERVQLEHVRVLGEVQLGDPLRHVRLASLDALRGDRALSDRLRRWLRSADAALTPWPLFVYDIFDFRRMRRVIEDYFRTMALENIPEEPVRLSFWTASNLALSARDRLALLVVDDALLRLHMEVRLIAQKSALCCVSCDTEVARRDHIFAMSTEGVHSNYTNLSGFMHDIITVSRATNTALSGAPSAEFSWFPGYTWTIALCAACMSHVGWRFDAQRARLRPQRFYGLCRNQVQPQGEQHALPPPAALAAQLRALARPHDA